MGLIVDAVSDIVTLPANSLQQATGGCNDELVPFLHGLAALADRMVMVLDLDRLAATEQMASAA